MIPINSHHWSVSTEKKQKVISHIKSYADRIEKLDNISNFKPVELQLYSYLNRLGYTDRTLIEFQNVIFYCKEKNDLKGIADSVRNFADDLHALELPELKQASKIEVNNNNELHNQINITLLEEILSNEIPEKKLEELKEILKSKKRGSIKEWFNNLGLNTLSGVITDLMLKLI